MTTFESGFKFGGRVHVDGDKAITATVIGFCFYPHGNQVQISWWNNGALVEQWVAPWRLTTAQN